MEARAYSRTSWASVSGGTLFVTLRPERASSALSCPLLETSTVSNTPAKPPDCVSFTVHDSPGEGKGCGAPPAGSNGPQAAWNSMRTSVLQSKPYLNMQSPNDLTQLAMYWRPR